MTAVAAIGRGLPPAARRAAAVLLLGGFMVVLDTTVTIVAMAAPTCWPSPSSRSVRYWRRRRGTWSR